MTTVLDRTKRIEEELSNDRYRHIDMPISLEMLACDYKDDNDALPTEGFVPLEQGALIEGYDKHVWVRTHIVTPSVGEYKRLYLLNSTGKEHQWTAINPQGLVYLNGEVVCGTDTNHTYIPLEPNTEYDVMIYFYTSMCKAESEGSRFRLDLVEEDERVKHIYYDLKIARECAECMDVYGDDYAYISSNIQIALNYLDMRERFSEEYFIGIDRAIYHIWRYIYGSASPDAPIVTCIGHSHVDLAWLWTMRQTKEKMQRTFATELMLMQEYDFHKFIASQPQEYQYVKEANPKLYERVKSAIDSGKWEPEGAMWVEADCNIPSGESLVRQIVYGKRFFRDEFGVESRVLWLPDVFGYSQALPQILNKTGVDYFVTSKISWNDTDKMPVDNFVWEGVDGSKIYTSFITAQYDNKGAEPQIQTTYCGDICPSQVLGAYRRQQQKAYVRDALITYGFGDGGGGPTVDMLEALKRLNKGVRGIPRTRVCSIGEYLQSSKQQFEQNCDKLRQVPTWRGELYLELHRGTYTSIATNKRNNRKSEYMLLDTEQLCAFDNICNGATYPSKIIDDTWREMLSLQFHDVIPGSSIKQVYQDSDKSYAKIFDTLGSLQDKVLEGISKKASGHYIAYNSNGFAIDKVYVDICGKYQCISNIPSMGYSVVEPIDDNGVVIGKGTIENNKLKVTFNDKMKVVSIYDKVAGRETLCGESGLKVYEDLPHYWDNWELSNYHTQKPYSIDNIERVEEIDKGARRGYRIVRKYLSSTIIEDITLTGDEGIVRYDYKIDWHEHHQILKGVYPLDIHPEVMSCDTQFSVATRPISRNTSWEQAKFEVCAHKWADLSEGDYGVALINDCKYGYSGEGNTLSISLIRCGTYPNEDADQGEHIFSLALYPHKGDWREGEVHNIATLFNRPIKMIESKGIGDIDKYSLVEIVRGKAILETFKKDKEGYTLRLYDNRNIRGKVTLRFGEKISRVYETDMLGNIIREVPIEGETVDIDMGVYEIKTLRVILSD